MTKVEIKNRYTGAVLFTADVPEGIESGLHTRVALEQAVAAKQDLGGAYLGGANLRDANLRDANLGGAYLGGAYLGGAYLGGANLRDANLGGANLGGANLRDANLGGAYLGGAKLRDDLLLVGDRPVLTIGPIGSVGRTIFAWVTNKGLRIEAGCFFGDRTEFVAQLAGEHGDNEHGREYTAALTLIDAHVEIWTPAAEAAEQQAA